MRVSAKRKKLFPVEESADGMGGPSGRVILSLSPSLFFSTPLTLSTESWLEYRTNYLARHSGTLSPIRDDVCWDRQSRQQNRLEKFPFVPFPLYALPVCSGACGGRWTTPSPCRTIRGFAEWMELMSRFDFSKSIVRFFLKFRGNFKFRDVQFYYWSLFFYWRFKESYLKKKVIYSIILREIWNLIFGSRLLNVA